MIVQVWIDGVQQEFSLAHIKLCGMDGKWVQIGLHEHMESVRFQLVEDGDIETETPLTEKRLRQLCREG